MPEITVSQGYYCFMPQSEQSVEAVLEKADKALYYVKEHGRNHYHIIEEA
jgi:GGDEF domain-containing protein